MCLKVEKNQKSCELYIICYIIQYTRKVWWLSQMPPRLWIKASVLVRLCNKRITWLNSVFLSRTNLELMRKVMKKVYSRVILREYTLQPPWPFMVSQGQIWTIANLGKGTQWWGRGIQEPIVYRWYRILAPSQEIHYSSVFKLFKMSALEHY